MTVISQASERALPERGPLTKQFENWAHPILLLPKLDLGGAEPVLDGSKLLLCSRRDLPCSACQPSRRKLTQEITNQSSRAWTKMSAPSMNTHYADNKQA